MRTSQLLSALPFIVILSFSQCEKKPYNPAPTPNSLTIVEVGGKTESLIEKTDTTNYGYVTYGMTGTPVSGNYSLHIACLKRPTHSGVYSPTNDDIDLIITEISSNTSWDGIPNASLSVTVNGDSITMTFSDFKFYNSLNTLANDPNNAQYITASGSLTSPY